MRDKLKDFLWVVGTLLLVLGIIGMPVGWGVNPKRDQSVFYNLADIGAFLRWAVAGVVAGLALMLASSLLRRRRP